MMPRRAPHSRAARRPGVEGGVVEGGLSQKTRWEPPISRITRIEKRL